MSSKPNELPEKKTNESVKESEPKKEESAKDDSKEVKSNESQKDSSKTVPKTASPAISESIGRASSSSNQTINSLASSEQSVVTIESLKYLQILDQYVSRKHWDFDIEYNLNAFCALLWCLVINYFLFYEIPDKCWSHLCLSFYMSVIVSTITCFDLTFVWIAWYLSLIYHFINRSKICLTVLSIHLTIGSLNLLVAVIHFGTNSCYQSGKLDSRLEDNIPVKYDLKTAGFMHLIIAINLFICAMLLAIKRNDFKFYVLWRKGLLNDYLQLDDES